MSNYSVSLRKSGPLALVRSGGEALREVPGLRAFVWRGFLLTYAVFLGSAAVVMGLVYLYAVRPIAQSLQGWVSGEGWWWTILVFLADVLLWITQLLLMTGTLLLSLLLALSLMGLWFEALAARIVAHGRGAPVAGAAFSLRGWLRSLGRTSRDSAALLLLSVLGIALGFVPIAGPLLVFAVHSYLLGWEVREPYFSVRAELEGGQSGGIKALRRGAALWTLRAGALPVFLALVPVVGWLLLPWAMVLLVAGFAWENENGALSAKAS